MLSLRRHVLSFQGKTDSCEQKLDMDKNHPTLDAWVRRGLRWLNGLHEMMEVIPSHPVMAFHFSS